MFFLRESERMEKESEFGSGIGGHGGVWECPDLIPFIVDGKKIWLLIMSINPGAPQGGSGTEYLPVGLMAINSYQTIRLPAGWIMEPTTIAGVSFSNTGKEKIFLGWMSNWQYAVRVPTIKWRSI
jgi:fructan beta-fructosidase